MAEKWSQFTNGGDMRAGDKTVGLRNGQNYQMTFPGTGIQDANGNFIFSYSASDNAVNYINYGNADTGSAPTISAVGQDATVGLNIETKGNGDINLDMGTGDLVINDSVGINEISDDDTFADATDKMASTSLAVKTYVDDATGAISDSTFITKTDETADLPNSIPLSGLASGILSNTTSTGVLNPRTITGTANQITATNGDGVSGNPTLSLPSTLIAPGTFQATTSLNVGGAGATVTSISTDGTLAANSDTLISTQKAVKTYADTADTAVKSYDYITKTNQTANLPNSVALSGIATGFLSNTTATGVLNSRTITGTSNEIDVTNGTGESGNPTLALSSTIVTPGTFAVGMGSVAVTTISNSAAATGDVLMNADAIQTAIANQIGSAKSFRGGYDASTNLFPSTGGSGVAGAIKAGDVWVITVAGTLGGTAVSVGDTIIALVDTPGQTSSNWSINANGVATWNGRAGVVTPQSGDYSFSQISGTAAINQGGTNATTIGAAGTLAQSSGTAYTFTTATYPAAATSAGTYLRADGTNWAASTATLPNTAGSSGTLLQSNGSGFTNTTATYPGTAGTSGTLLTSNGTNIVNTTATYPASAGTSGTILRSNGTNIVNSTPTFPNTATSGKVMRGDGTNWVESTPTYPNTANTGKILRGDGTNWAETTAQYPDTAGTSGNVLTSNGTNWISSAAFIPSSYGTLRWANGETGGAFSFTTTPAEMNNIASISYAISGGSSNFALSGTGRLQYTGATTKKFAVRAGLAWAELAFGVNMQMYLNGSAIGGSTYTAGGNNNSPTFVITMAQNDYISIYGWRVATALTIISAWISATEFSTQEKISAFNSLTLTISWRR